jgi:hypothetical protein
MTCVDVVRGLRWAVLATTVTLAACGGGGSSPTAPSPTPGPAAAPAPAPAPAARPTTWALTGRVTDSGTSAGISGATVAIGDGPNAGRSATTDTGGNFSLAGLQQSGFTVNVTAPGYGSVARGFTLTSDQTTTFQLARNIDGLWRASAPSSSIRSVEFRVTNNTLVELSLTYLLDFPGPFGSSSCTATITQRNMSTAISGNSFSAPLASGGFSTTVSATFSTASGGSGSVATVRFENWQCGSFTTNGFASGASFVFSKVS